MFTSLLQQQAVRHQLLIINVRVTMTTSNNPINTIHRNTNNNIPTEVVKKLSLVEFVMKVNNVRNKMDFLPIAILSLCYLEESVILVA